jgi:hypothetical protein
MLRSTAPRLRGSEMQRSRRLSGLVHSTRRSSRSGLTGQSASSATSSSLLPSASASAPLDSLRMSPSLKSTIPRSTRPISAGM